MIVQTCLDKLDAIFVYRSDEGNVIISLNFALMRTQQHRLTLETGLPIPFSGRTDHPFCIFFTYRHIFAQMKTAVEETINLIDESYWGVRPSHRCSALTTAFSPPLRFFFNYFLISWNCKELSNSKRAWLFQHKTKARSPQGELVQSRRTPVNAIIANKLSHRLHVDKHTETHARACDYRYNQIQMKRV